MADQPTTPSGSRWEPDPEAITPAAETPAALPEQHEQDGAALDPALDRALDPAVETVDVGHAVDAERRTTAQRRAVLAGAATAVALGAGLTGFVIGHAAGNDSTGFSPAGFTGQQNGQQNGQQGGQLGDGQRPPGFGRDGAPDGDGDHGFGPPQGSTDGGSSSSSSGNGAGTPGNPT